MGEVNDMKQPTLTRGAVAKIDQIDFVRLCVYTIRLCEVCSEVGVRHILWSIHLYVTDYGGI